MVHSKQLLQLAKSMKQQLTVNHNQLLVIQLKPTEAKGGGGGGGEKKKKKKKKKYIFHFPKIF